MYKLKLLFVLIIIYFNSITATHAVEYEKPSSVPYGIYHLPDKIDAFNIELSKNNTFRWGFYGCDSGANDKGRLTISEGAVFLIPDEGQEYFKWVHGGGINEVSQIKLTLSKSDKEIIAIGKGTINGVDFEQVWKAGGMCAKCMIGPWGQESCENPYLGDIGEWIRNKNK
jgi:hypothetical protein